MYYGMQRLQRVVYMVTAAEPSAAGREGILLQQLVHITHKYCRECCELSVRFNFISVFVLLKSYWKNVNANILQISLQETRFLWL